MISAPSEIRCKRDAENCMTTKRDREHQRDRDRHDDAGPPAERDEADRRARWRSPRQALGELADRLFDDMRLVGDEVHVDADRQLARDLPAMRVLRWFAERQHVAARAHRDGEPDRRLAVEAEHRLRRIGVAARDVAMSLRRKKRPLARKLTALRLSSEANSPETRIAIRSAPASTMPLGINGVLRLQRLRSACSASMPEGRQLLGRELEVDLLVLGADEVDLGDVLHAQQLGCGPARASRAARDA